ncbi:uncharacterized protein LOC143458654 [Clavelina lepadiformis]|uniref:uncharacterized protein LOC143458654 n=1 Tax=Clavelina lepadiformis TaxID=159417 RepID=UPI004041C44D
MADNRPLGRDKAITKAPSARSARRNLFGRDPRQDDDDLAKERDDLAKKDGARFAKQWNFDTSADAPLPGKYEWGQPIMLNQRTPLMYAPVTQTGSSPKLSTLLDSKSSDSKATSLCDSVSSGDFSHSVTSSSDDMSSPSRCQPTNFVTLRPPAKRQRSSSPEHSGKGRIELTPSKP